jgi:autotransporter-associated beta strand protein
MAHASARGNMFFERCAADAARDAGSGKAHVRAALRSRWIDILTVKIAAVSLRSVSISPSFLVMPSRLVLPLILVSAIAPVTVKAADAYWDSNGVTPGAGATPTGTWGTDLFWSPDATGALATGAWVSGDVAIFAAGSDATNPYTVTLNGTQTVGGLKVEEGAVSLVGTGAVSLGANAIVISAGATLSSNSSLRVTSTAGSTITINGGTLETTNPGAAGTFFDTDSQIILGAAGGTLSHVTANILNIVQTAAVVTGPGSLTKTGVGVLAIAGTATYAGPTFVNDGELRIRGTANRLPVGTAVTVQSPGILNLNGVAQEIGSLSGNGNVGTGAATLTIGGSASTTFNGALKNIANAGASGVTTGNGRLIKNGTGVITFNGVNDLKGSITLNDGGIIVSNSGVLSDPIADLIVNGGALTLNNAAQTIENLSGTGGTITLGAGHTFTSDPAGSTTFSGAITGPGGFTKANVLSGATARTLTLAGANSYTGATTVSGGGLVVTGSLSGTSKVDVSGTLGGTGSIAPAIAGDITLLGSGRLAPGVAAGTLSTSFSGGGALDITAAVTPSNSQSLVFDLDAPGSSDKVTLTGGALEIGTGVLEFNDFAFAPLGGFVENADYVLFDGDTPIAGTLGPGITGNIGTAIGQLQLADGGRDLVLHVVPEPGTAAILLGGIATLTTLQRFRRLRS